MRVVSDRRLAWPFVAGAAGGILVSGAILAVMAASGWFGSSTKTVTVQETPIVPATASQHTGGLTAHEIYERDARGVVFVSSTGVSETPSVAESLKGEGGEQGTSTGSGFEIDGDGTILTNWHVVQNAVKVMVSLGEHGQTVQARVIGKDPSHDLAVLRIPTGGLTLHPLTLGDSSEAQVGDPVLAIGNPFDLGRTLTTGVISALQRRITSPNGLTINDVFQTDTPINPGNSGGPLLDEYGAVIAINSQIETNGSRGGSVGIAFAIPIGTAKSELPALEKDGTVASGSH
jgi:S1-C subfamily serine protease